jgi:hypothetical protein
LRTFSEVRLSPLWRLVHWAYRSPSDLLLVESGELVTTIRSAEGIRQGDVLSSLLFSHTVLPLYSLACSEFPQVSAVAIMDDVEFVGPFSQLFLVLDRLIQHAPEYGLSLQFRKCSMLWPRPAPAPASLSSGCLQRGLPVVLGGIPVLGSMVSLDPLFFRDWLLSRVTKAHSRLFDFLGSRDLPSHPCVCALTFVSTSSYVLFVPCRPSCRARACCVVV